MHKEFKEFLEQLTEKGYQCWLHQNPFNSTYCFVVKGDQIAYAQFTQGVFQLSTVHRPCQEAGTGFRIDGDMGLAKAIRSIDDVLNMVAPGWASNRDRKAVRKFKDWADFEEHSWCKHGLFGAVNSE